MSNIHHIFDYDKHISGEKLAEVVMKKTTFVWRLVDVEDFDCPGGFDSPINFRTRQEYRLVEIDTIGEFLE
jgi:hypothetical protein